MVPASWPAAVEIGTRFPAERETRAALNGHAVPVVVVPAAASTGTIYPPAERVSTA
jgi:hypothetical protein